VAFTPCMVRTPRPGGGELGRLGHPLLDAYLDLVNARARPNTAIATAFDLKVFFTVIDKDPGEVTVTDVLAFIKAQREPRRGAKVVRIEDGEQGLSVRTIKRRLATIAGLYEYLIIRGDTAVAQNPVPRGLAMRRPGQRAVRGVPLIRAPRTLPRVIDPIQVDTFVARSARDATARWSRRCCSAVYAAARSSAYAWATSGPVNADCSSPRARADTSATCRCPSASSPPWAATSTMNDLRPPWMITPSWC